MKVNKKNILIATILCVLIVLMGIPFLHLGYVRLGDSFTLTLMHIPLVLSSILCGLPGGLAAGLAFGITSLVNAICYPGSSLDSMLKNPFCSILPALIYGTLPWSLSKIFSLTKIPTIATQIVSAFLSSLLHSFILIGAMYVFLHDYAVRSLYGLKYFSVMKIILPKSFWESAMAAVAVALVLFGIDYLNRKKEKDIEVL